MYKGRGAEFIVQGAGAQGQSPSGIVPSLKIFKVVRFPGGLLADKYHWIVGVAGEAARRGEIGIREFAEFCEKIGAEKMLTVNFKTGTAEEAANWVEFANGVAPEKIPDEWRKVPYAYNHKAPEGYFAYLRESLERKEPYGVRFWEIGNEIDWWNRIDAASYAREVIQYAQAMRLKDRTILIGACASPLDDEWNKALLQIAGRYIDFISIHIYGGPERAYEDRNEEYRVLFYKNEVVGERLKKIKELIYRYAPHCKIAVTEANTSYNEFKLGKDELKKLKSALWIARLKNSLIRQGVFAYCHWNLIDGGAYGVVDLNGGVTPTYEVLWLFAQYTGNEVLGTGFRVQGSGEAREQSPFGDSPLRLDYVATIDREKKKAYVMVVNVEPGEIEAEIDLRGLRVAGSAVVRTLHSADGLGLESQKVHITQTKAEVEAGKIRCAFLPASVTCIEVGL